MTPPPHGPGDGQPPMAYVYLLQSVKDGKAYTGWTTDVIRRLAEHNAGQVFSTKRRAPFKLLGYEPYGSVVAAKQRERNLKHNSRMLAQFKKRLRYAPWRHMAPHHEVVG